ncbi:hypothetical protein DL766_008129 [Monosporascus sp. MC13-8B]|uniref:Rhodopsin domain-containing protein n=1 Tax=Monosporascus cannonballus TaxID=155416 RepID=A0ABY0HB65_9PEZI|nr:hypothetical protein DL762_004750 [Monosporascus cannonballus]RYP01294.1 hypothetical protein DL763_000266 [Monosporascus cannonballus]RYP20674.1 hypothetical protein DL766_008129 [Monosporascus sp. MC13-8B]
MNSVNSTATVVDPERAAESNTVWIVAVVTVFHALALLCVGLRVYAKIWATRAPWWDDVFIVCSAEGGLSIIQISHGLGKHQDTIDRAHYKIFQHAAFWQSVISATASLTFLKVSIALSLLRLGFSKWYKWSLWAIIFASVCVFISGIFTFFFCRPLEGYWDKSLRAVVMVRGGLSNTAFNIVSDIALASLSVPVVWRLKMDRRTRLYVIGILSLGYPAVAMGIVKAVYQITYGSTKDKTFTQSVQFWGFLQPQLGIIAACATSLKPSFRRILKLPSSAYNRYNHNYNDISASSRHKSVALVTIGGTGAMPQQKPGHRTAPGDNDTDSETSHFYAPTAAGNSAASASAGIYQHGSDGSTSKEMILPRTCSRRMQSMRAWLLIGVLFE